MLMRRRQCERTLFAEPRDKVLWEKRGTCGDRNDVIEALCFLLYPSYAAD